MKGMILVDGVAPLGHNANAERERERDLSPTLADKPTGFPVSRDPYLPRPRRCLTTCR